VRPTSTPPRTTVACDFTNVERGRIRVIQAVAPIGDPQAFDFQLSGGPDAVAAAFALQGGSRLRFGAAPGNLCDRPVRRRPGVGPAERDLHDGGSLISAVSVAPARS
jgi:hypothetical protein